MKALYFEEHGDLDVIQYGEVPDPILGPNQVLVKVHACALNHLDIRVRRGWHGLKLEMPHWGAGGGVNSMALQVAKLAGATVYAVASTRDKANRALELGADFVFDRSEANWPKEIY